MNRGRTLRRLFFSSALALIPASVGASSRSVGLTVLRSAQALDCPDGAQLRSQVEQILQHSLTESRAAAEAVRIQVEFSRTGDGYAAQVLFQDPKPGERALQDRGERCSALAQAVSVTIALFLDQELVQDQPAKNANATKEASAAPIAGSPSRKEPPVRDAEPRSWQARGALEGGAGWFTSNTLQPVLALELGVKAKRFILEAGLVGVLPDSSRFGAGEVRTSLLLGVARACYAFGARLSFGPCAEFGLGSVRGSGLGYAESRTVALLWSAVGVGALFEGELGSRGFGGASAVLWLPTRRQTFSVENAGIAWESRTFSLALLLRAGVRLW